LSKRYILRKTRPTFAQQLQAAHDKNMQDLEVEMDRLQKCIKTGQKFWTRRQGKAVFAKLMTELNGL